jgi:ribosomal protein S18 acetylase RimI-like enzyme
MSGAHDSYLFSLVPSSEGEVAFAFHKRIASSNSHIWPRTQAFIEKLAYDDCLFGARSSDSGEYAGLCYSTLDELEKEWELGGLIVDPPVRKLGIGEMLARLALAHTMVVAQPWNEGQNIVAYVHEANSEPRRLLEKLGFQWAETIEIPADTAPPEMKRNSAGNLIGDKFVFTPQGLVHLSDWFDREFDGTIDNGKVLARINLGFMNLDQLRASLRDLANKTLG